MMLNNRRLMSAVLAVGVLFLSSVVPALTAQTSTVQTDTMPSDAAPRETLEFRRWLAPAQRIEDWPFGPFRYWPVERNVFEQRVGNLPQALERQEFADTPFFSRIVLHASLTGQQFVGGTGFLEVWGQTARSSIPLEPWNLWATILPEKAQPPANEEPAPRMVSDAQGRLQLVLPQGQHATSVVSSILFEWSLQGKADPQGNWKFDFELPPCLCVELLLDLPATLIPSSDGGIVAEIIPEAGEVSQERTQRRWQILLGNRLRPSVTISADRSAGSSRRQTGFQWATRYTVAPEGLDVTATLTFDDSVALLSELLLDVEEPLQIVGIRADEQPVAWTQGQGTRVHIDLSRVVRPETNKLVIEALASPPKTDGAWTLPRMLVKSPNLLWKETRCGLNVLRPLQVQSLDALQAIQVSPQTAQDFLDRELFVFQCFEEDAALTLDVTEYQPAVTTAGAAHIQWGISEVRGRLVLDCGIPDGELFTLRFPVTPDWTIDSVTGRNGTNDAILHWEVIENEEASLSAASRYLSVQLKQQLLPRQICRLQITGRFQAAERRDFLLRDFMPLAVTPSREAEHYVVLQQTNSRDSLVPSQATPATAPLDPLRQAQRYIADASGRCFALDRHGKMSFVLERLKPSYAGDIDGTVTVGTQKMDIDFRIRCQPMNSAVDRVYVCFPPSAQTAEQTTWTWTSGVEASPSLLVRAVPAEEMRTLLPESEYSGDAAFQGETWEIRLSTPQSAAFDLHARSSIPLADELPIPLASLPLASTQQGSIALEAPAVFPFQIINSRLKSIPIPATKWFRYEETKAAFRYDPQEEARLSQHTPVRLKRLPENALSPMAWVWSLRLDSQFDSGGFVKHYATFLIENRGKDRIRLALPDGLTTNAVRAVWRDDQRATWCPEPRRPTDRFYPATPRVEEAAEAEVPDAVIAVALPEGARFVAVSLEYGSAEAALDQQQMLRPRYPEADVPILASDWTAWLPPEFEISTPVQKTGKADSRHGISQALNWLCASASFDPFSRSDWDWLWHDQQRTKDAAVAARHFFDSVIPDLDHRTQKRDTKNSPAGLSPEPMSGIPSPFGRAFATEEQTTWTALFGEGQHFIERLTDLHVDGVQNAEVKVFVDSQSLAMLGIVPGTPTASTAAQKWHGSELFQQSGLVLFVSITHQPDQGRSHHFYVTSALVPSRLGHRHIKAIGAGAYYIAASEGQSGEFFDPNSPRWTSLEQWLQQSSSPDLPWSLASQLVRVSAATPDWNAFEFDAAPDGVITVIPPNASATYCWLAFLVTVLLTTRKPLSHPAILVLLLLLFETLARWVAPQMAGVPSGAFFGVLVALAFGLIRPKSPRKDNVRPHGPLPYQDDSDGNDSHHGVATASAATKTAWLGFFMGVLVSSALSTETVVAQNTPLPATIPPRPARKEAYRVFFPTDDEQRIIGNLVYVPDEFLTLLDRHIKRVEPMPFQHWSIAKAEYRGAIQFNPLSQKLELDDDFRVLLDIVLDAPQATILLPPLPLLRDHATWDERPVTPLWRTVQNADTGLGVTERKVLAFHVENETPGLHHLELALAPPVQTQSETNLNSVILGIPKVADATLRMQTTPETSPLTVTTGNGAIKKNSFTDSEFVAQIGPVEQLAFSWANEPEREAFSTVEVEQHFSLLARPTQVELRATFSFRIDGGRIRFLDLLLDPRWQLSGQVRCEEYPMVVDEKPFQQQETADMPLPFPQNKGVRLTFSELVSGTVTVHAGFVLRDFGGIGQIRLPRIQALNAQLLKSTLSVAADAALEIHASDSGLIGGTSSDTAEILNTERAEKPVAVYDLMQADPAWTLAVRPKKIVPSAELTYSVLLDKDESNLQCRANFSAPGPVFRQRFSAPSGWRIDSIELRDAQRKPIPVRWTTTEPVSGGETVWDVFFRQAVSGRYSMILDGTFRPEDHGEQAANRLPTPRWENVNILQNTLHIFRTASTLVRLQTAGTEWRAAASPAPHGDSSLPDSHVNAAGGRALGSWETEKTQASLLPEYRFFSNSPQVRGEQVTSLTRRAGESWEVVCDFFWDIDGGELDTVRLHWDERCEIRSVEPPMAWNLEQHQGAAVLVLTPETPLAGQHHLRIRTMLTRSSVSLPKVSRWSDNPASDNVQRYVVLPRLAEGEVIPWSLTMLEKLEADQVAVIEALQKAAPDSSQNGEDATLFFKTLAEDYSAVISQPAALPIAELYDVTLVIQKNGNVLGQVTVDLRNPGQEGLMLRMPPSYELIEVSSSGIASQSIVSQSQGSESQGGARNRWKIDLWPSDYPQRLRILFCGTLSRHADTQTRSFELPVLEGVNVRKTLWTLSLDDKAGQPSDMLQIATLREKTFLSGSESQSDGIRNDAVPPGILGMTVTNLGPGVLTTGDNTISALGKLHLLRLANLLTILEQVVASNRSRSEELQRWYTQWQGEWQSLQRELHALADRQQRASASSPPGQHGLLLDLAGANSEESDLGTTELYVDAKNITQPLQALTLAYHNIVSRYPALNALVEPTPENFAYPLDSSTASANAPLRGHVGRTENVVFGLSRGQINGLQWQTPPSTAPFGSLLNPLRRFGTSLLVLLVLPILMAVCLRHFSFRELWMQCPHFWGTATGLMLLSAAPPGYLGLAVLAFTVFSLLYPVWPKHPEFFERNR